MRRSAILLGLFLPLVAETAGHADALHRSVASLTPASGVSQTVSRRCGACHNPEFSLWVGHPHSHFLIDPDQDPRLIEALWDESVPGWHRYAAGRFHKGDVALAYGLLQIQVFFRRDSDGHRLLPAQWNLREERWEPLQAALEALRKEHKTWEEECAGCHTTGFDHDTMTFKEPNVGCEACHGDGTRHAESEGKEPILSPSTLSAPRRTDICGACHSRGRSRTTGHPYAEGFRPGKTLTDVFLLEQPSPGSTTAFFWPDGTERLPFMEYQGFIQSGHHRAGLTCVTCHNPHGSDREHNLRRKTDELCGGCHGERLDTCPGHREHPTAKAECTDCHMSLSNPEPDQAHVHTHTFRFLEPERAARTGIPSSCTLECHPRRTLPWAVQVLREWRSRTPE